MNESLIILLIIGMTKFNSQDWTPFSYTSALPEGGAGVGWTQSVTKSSPSSWRSGGELGHFTGFHCAGELHLQNAVVVFLLQDMQLTGNQCKVRRDQLPMEFALCVIMSRGWRHFGCCSELCQISSISETKTGEAEAEIAARMSKGVPLYLNKGQKS